MGDDETVSRLQWENLPGDIKRMLARGSKEAAELLAEDEARREKILAEQEAKNQRILVACAKAIESSKAALRKAYGLQEKQPRGKGQEERTTQSETRGCEVLEATEEPKGSQE